MKLTPVDIDPFATDAQKAAGNYRKSHERIHGLDITLEIARGSERTGIGKNGKRWSVTMPAHYGYIKRTEGADGENVDCYIGGNPSSRKVFIVNQLNAETGKFDEHKCLLGFNSRRDAEETYKRGFSDGKGGDRMGHVAETDVDEFKRWVYSKKTEKPVVAKATKTAVDYSAGMPKSHCGICRFYSNHACERVFGHIDPSMWCRLYQHRIEREEGGRVSGFSAQYSGGNEIGGPLGKHKLDLSVPITPDTNVTGQFSAAPNYYGPGRSDFGVRLGVRKSFQDGGMPVLRRTAPFPEVPEGYEYYDPPDGGASPSGKTSGVGAVPGWATTEGYLPNPEETASMGELPSTGLGAVDRLLGVGGQERYQLWPEKFARGPLAGFARGLGETIKHGFTAAHDVMSGEVPIRTGLRREDFTDIPPPDYVVRAEPNDPLIERGQDMAAVAGFGFSPKASLMAKSNKVALPLSALEEKTMAENAHRGLSFPAEEALDRLRQKLEREASGKVVGEPQERIIIKAPEGKGLPDFVVGKITPQDWIARHEALLSPDEIKNSAKWYDMVFGEFLKQTKGDVEKAKKYMRGWLVAQQNIDVGGAMNNMLLQAEQIKRGVAPEQMRAAGMPNPTSASRSVMSDKPIEGGVGQKISDFVDSAEGKDVRAWLGNHPSGGRPFVVDVHTGRDTGLVDDKLINHLTRLGYDKDALKNLKVDLKGSPTYAQYEGRANFGRDLTDYLNGIRWQGRSDWKPHEVQAIGWMGMTKLTASKGEDIVSGLTSSARHVSMEASPGEGSPWHAKYGERFGSLPPEEQHALTVSVTQSAIEHASNLAGIDVRDIVHGTGGWKYYSNPSTVAQTFATQEGAEIAANALGHMLQQTEVWSNKVKPLTANPKGFAVDFIAGEGHNLHTDAGLRDFWAKVMDADPMKGTKKPLFEGYQPITTADGRVGIRVLIDRGGKVTQSNIENALSGPVNNMVKTLPHDMTVQLREAEITKARNDWKVNKNGQAYNSRLRELLGRDPAAYLGSAGKELEKIFGRGIEEAEARKAPAATSPEAAAPVIPGRPYQEPTGMALRSETSKPGLALSAIEKSAPNQMGLYSSVARSIETSPQSKAPPQQWMATIRNAPGVKPDELKWMGIEDWLKEQKGPVTKDQIADYVRANQIEVKEVMKGGGDRPYAVDNELRKLTAENISLTREYERAAGNTSRQAEITDQMNANHDRIAQLKQENEGGPTKFSSYTLPGGENYREMLLTLPEKEIPSDWKIVRHPDAADGYAIQNVRGEYGMTPNGQRRAFWATPAEAKMAIDDGSYAPTQPASIRSSDTFQSSHYDEPNILAHVRFNDRTIDGKKTLFVEEVQSDWHQKGRSEGYQTGQLREGKVVPQEGGLWKIDWADGGFSGGYVSEQSARSALDERSKLGGVPDAPFKTTWPELAMKRIIRYAAENGYEKVAWTPGEVQNARYDLSKQVDAIKVARNDQSGNFSIYGQRKGGSGFEALAHEVPQDKIQDYVGKDLAGKVIGELGPESPWGVKNKKSGNWSPRFNTKDEAEAYQRSLPETTRGQTKVMPMTKKYEADFRGVDLKIGGEGMQGFYDQMMPSMVNKLVKKYGAKVEQGRLAIPHKGGVQGQVHQIHTLDITPQLRKGAMEQGFPMFARGGSVKSVKPRLTPVAHNPFETHNSIMRAIHGR